MALDQSILDSTKKILGLSPDYTAFDQDIATHINSVFSTLEQLGVGPVGGFFIEDKAALWGDLLGSDARLNLVKSYVYLRVRLIFDPPATSFTQEAMKEQIREMEWRISVVVENDKALVEGPQPLVWILDTPQLPADAAEGDVGIVAETGDVWRKV